MIGRFVRAVAFAAACVHLLPGTPLAGTVPGGLEMITLIRPTCRIVSGGRSLKDPPGTQEGGAALSLTCTRGFVPIVTIGEGNTDGRSALRRGSGNTGSNLLAVERRPPPRQSPPAVARRGTVVATVHF